MSQSGFGGSKSAVTRLPGEGIFSIPVFVPDPGVLKITPQPGGTEQTAYRLISVPLNLDDKSPRAVLEDNLGTYDDTRWRFSNVVFGSVPKVSA